jgi:hypothetical protein
MRKRLLIATAVLVVLAVIAAPFALFLWPVHNLRLGMSAAKRVDADVVAGYPAAVVRTQAVEKHLRGDHPEMASARFSWRQVSCSIEDWSAQLAVAEFAQECTLETIWMVPVERSRWDDCLDVDHGEFGQDADYSVTRLRSWMFRAGEENCPVLDGGSGWQIGELSIKVVEGRRPPTFGRDTAWLVYRADVSMSTTMIGCRPALPFCRATFSRPRMDAVANLRRS